VSFKLVTASATCSLLTNVLPLTLADSDAKLVLNQVPTLLVVQLVELLPDSALIFPSAVRSQTPPFATPAPAITRIAASTLSLKNAKTLALVSTRLNFAEPTLTAHGSTKLNASLLLLKLVTLLVLTISALLLFLVAPSTTHPRSALFLPAMLATPRLLAQPPPLNKWVASSMELKLVLSVVPTIATPNLVSG
jgi:hypothetical protein